MTKITALTAITGANVAAGDQVQIVDVSDTAMAASGTNKSLTWDELRKTFTNPMLLDVIADPAVPAANQLKIYARKLAGRVHPAWEGPLGVGSSVQPILARNSVSLWQANANLATLSSWGPLGPPAASIGTATLVAPATTNIYTWMRKVEALVTVAATTAVAGWRGAQLTAARGNAAGIGGFWFICRWGPSTGVATTTNRGFCGLRGAVTNPTDVQPSSLTQIVGCGWDAADTNIQFMSNDGTGTATKIDLGASFPVPTSDRTKMYETAVFCAPNDTTVYYEMTDIGTGAVASGSTATDLPTNTQMLAPLLYMSAGGTSSVIGVGLSSLYLEMDN